MLTFENIKVFKTLSGFKTVRFVKLLGEKVNIGEWVLGIFEQCNYGHIMDVRLGISFTAAQGIRQHGDQIVKYMYCPKSAASFHEQFRTREEALEWGESLKVYDNPQQFILLSFLNNDFGEFFKGSGWSVRKPIAVHLWIQK